MIHPCVVANGTLFRRFGRKYIKVTQHVMENYGVDLYTRQRVDWLSDSVDSLFNDDTVTVMTLGDFL